MNSFKRILPYLLLNVVVSAVTTILVLVIWDQGRQPITPATGGLVAPSQAENANPASTLPSLDAAVIQVENAVGVGDINNEVIVLKRVGEGELQLSGWRISNGSGKDYVFPELVLNKNGSVRLYTHSGQNTVIELYWGQPEAVWKPGDTVSLYDPENNLRASYNIP